MKLRVLVVDDEDLPRQRVCDLTRGHPDLRLVGEAAAGAEALDRIVALQPHLVFLDVRMPELDGFAVVAALEPEEMPAIVFVTAYDAYAIRAFDVGAFDYLMKPVTRERFDAAVQRVLRRVAGAPIDALRALAAAIEQRRGYATRFVARHGGRHYLVPVRDISWIEAEGNYVRLHSFPVTHLVRHTMKEIEGRLDPAQFVRIHRSCIIALDSVRSVAAREHGEYTVTLTDGSRHVSSRTYSPRVRALLRPRA